MRVGYLEGRGVRARIQVFKRKFQTHIHLDYTRIEILFCVKKEKKKKKREILVQKKLVKQVIVQYTEASNKNLTSYGQFDLSQ